MALQKIRSINQLIYPLDLPEDENRVVEVIEAHLSAEQVGTFYQVAHLLGLDSAWVILSYSLSDELVLEIAQKLDFFIGKNLKVAMNKFDPPVRVPLTVNALQDAIADIYQNLAAFPPEDTTDKRLRDIALLQRLSANPALANSENRIEDSGNSFSISDLIGDDMPSDLDTVNSSIIGTVYFGEDGLHFSGGNTLSQNGVPSRKKQSSNTDVKYKKVPIGQPQPPQIIENTGFTGKLSDEEFARRVKFRADMEYQIEQLAGPESVKREVVRRFTRLEKVEVLKGSGKPKLEIHAPRQTANFLKAFSSEESLKFATHTYDDNFPFSYKEWINNCRKAFKLLESQYPAVPVPTRAKLHSFLFQADPDPKKGWGFDRIAFGWSHAELQHWCVENPGVSPSSPPSMPIPKAVNDALANTAGRLAIPNFEALCKRFAHEIRFRGSEGAYLEKFLRQKSRQWGLDTNHCISYDESLRSLDFYLDVDRFSAALKQILITIKERPQHPNVLFSGKDMADRVEIKVYQEGSVVTRPSTDSKVAVDTLTGNLKNAWNNLLGHCHWSMEAAFTDGKKRLHYLGEVGQPAVEDAPETEGGVLHTFTFLKPDK